MCDHHTMCFYSTFFALFLVLLWFVSRFINDCDDVRDHDHEFVYEFNAIL